MIYGIGVDLASVKRIEQSLDRHGQRFVRRLLASAERDEFSISPHPTRFMAKRFAIKEAASKALGTGIRDGVSFHDFVTTHDSMGRPQLEVSGRAAELCNERGIKRFHLSVSDEGDIVVAYALFEA